MQTIGLIGGMSWQSTAQYYKLINEMVNQKLGGHHSAKILLASVDFQELCNASSKYDWGTVAQVITQAAQSLEKAGADFFLICANTTHKVAPQVTAQVQIPFLHIIDATAQAIKTQDVKKVALLGTKPTMSDGFYQNYMAKHQIEILSPEADDQEIVHKIIFEELIYGKLLENSRKEYLRIIATLASKGAQGVIAGCTEIPLLIQQKDVSLPFFDTTKIHAEAAVQRALG